ncbi:coronin-1B [Platysternon megacephalum]|uniref:General transcription and DNA repair factor IIH subunit TFB5 n=1 Tax=Platysternon megacephalum TaxID=55544 RepID=A0A4D9DUP6_9SAUR|nr:coronin-1B [Platysternon megacephalum]
MKQFLLYLDESNALGKKFIIQDLDETHVFVLAELVNFLQERVGELMDQNSFPITQKEFLEQTKKSSPIFLALGERGVHGKIKRSRGDLKLMQSSWVSPFGLL